MLEDCLPWIDAEEGSIRKGQAATVTTNAPLDTPGRVFSQGAGSGSVVAAFCHKSPGVQKRQRSCTLQNRFPERRELCTRQQRGREYTLRILRICTGAPRTLQLNTGTWGNYQKPWKEAQKRNRGIGETRGSLCPHLLLHRQVSVSVTRNEMSQ